LGGGAGGDGAGGDGAGGRGTGGEGGALGDGAGVEVVEPTCELSTTRGSPSGAAVWTGASPITSGPLDVAAAPGRFVASSFASGSAAGSRSERSRAWRPVSRPAAENVRLSCTPRTALLREIATLLPWPPPTPGSSGRPGKARPIHSTLANVAVAESPADSKVDRSLEAIEDRVGVCRLFSMSANRSYLPEHRPSPVRRASPIRVSRMTQNRQGRTPQSAFAQLPYSR
jgi:hypothetical protein